MKVYVKIKNLFSKPRLFLKCPKCDHDIILDLADKNHTFACFKCNTLFNNSTILNKKITYVEIQETENNE